MKVRYTVVLEPNAGTGIYTVTVPALPGCITQGATLPEALAHAREAIAGFVHDLTRNGEQIPVEEPGFAIVSLEAEVDIAAAARASA
jgi:predicted RNase H-like HicB family nuclease